MENLVAREQDLANAVALRVEEFGESYEKTRAFIMKYAVQHRERRNPDAMDTNEMHSGWDNYAQDEWNPLKVNDLDQYYNQSGVDPNAAAYGKGKTMGGSKGKGGKGGFNTSFYLGGKGPNTCQEKGKGKGKTQWWSFQAQCCRTCGIHRRVL